MDENDILLRLDAVIASAPNEEVQVAESSRGTRGHSLGFPIVRQIPDAIARLYGWHASAAAVVASAVPLHGALAAVWTKASTAQYDNPHGHRQAVPKMVGVLTAIRAEVAAGRLRTFEQAVQAFTVGEVLDQAEQLLDKGYLAAATVLAGGALETHLRHLCARAGLLDGEANGINDYLGLLDRSRKAGVEVVASTGTQDAKAWAKRRNDAAHDPANFQHARQAVELMVQGVRLFIRTYP